MPGAQRRASVDKIQEAANAVKNFNAEQANNLAEYAKVEKSLRSNWTSVKGTAVLDQKTQVITRSSMEMQQALEKMQADLNKYASFTSETATKVANAVDAVDTGRSYSIT